MKKRNLSSLKLNKASISSLQFIQGGYEEQQSGAADGAADGPAGPGPVGEAVFSIGHACSKRNSCRRVCGESTNTLPKA